MSAAPKSPNAGTSKTPPAAVTTSAARVKSIVHACSQLERGHGLFLFADRTILEMQELLFAVSGTHCRCPGSTQPTHADNSVP